MVKNTLSENRALGNAGGLQLSSKQHADYSNEIYAKNGLRKVYYFLPVNFVLPVTAGNSFLPLNQLTGYEVKSLNNDMLSFLACSRPCSRTRGLCRGWRRWRWASPPRAQSRRRGSPSARDTSPTDWMLLLEWLSNFTKLYRVTLVVAYLGCVYLDLDVPSPCPHTQPVLPNSHLPNQNPADSGTSKFKSTQPR